MKKNLLLTIIILMLLSLTGCSLNNKVNVNFILDGTNNIVKIKKDSVIENDIIPYSSDNSFELYYDEYFDEKYNNDIISDDTDIYVKEIYINKIYVKVVVNYEKQNIIIDKNSSFTFEDLPEQYKNIFIGCYYDSDYTRRYNGEELSEDTILYLKTISTGTFEIEETLLNKVREQYLQQEYFPIFPHWEDPLGFFFGCYNGAVVHILNTGYTYSKIVDIKGYEFSRGYEWIIYVWKGNEFYSLESEDVFEKGILTIENLCDIHNVYLECETNGYINFRKMFLE